MRVLQTRCLIPNEVYASLKAAPCKGREGSDEDDVADCVKE